MQDDGLYHQHTRTRECTFTHSHPCLHRYYDCFEEHGTLQIEMEYADGGTLAQYLAKRQGRPLSHPAIVSLLVGISSALEHIHGHDILHRDLKSDNVFLMLSGEIKLGDFGIAKQLSTSSQGGRKKTNTLLGTPHYISPELCSGNPYDSKSDMWSLGCILHEMVTLNKAFTSENLPALVNKIMECEYVVCQLYHLQRRIRVYACACAGTRCTNPFGPRVVCVAAMNPYPRTHRKTSSR